MLQFAKTSTHSHRILHFDTLQIYSCGKHREKRKNYLLTHYHTMPHFDALKIYSCGTSNFSFSHNVFCPIWHSFFILSAVCFSLDQSKILSSDNGLTSNFSFSHNVFYPIWYIFSILNALQPLTR